MPIKKSAIKEFRKAKRRTERNSAILSRIKTLKKKLFKSSSAEEAGKVLMILSPVAQRSAAKGVLHQKTASRIISRANLHINKLKKAPAQPAVQ